MTKKQALNKLHKVAKLIDEIRNISNELDESALLPDYHLDTPSLAEFGNTVVSAYQLIARELYDIEQPNQPFSPY